MRVLYLSANPTWTETLRLDDELKEIKDVLQWGITWGHASLSIVPEVKKSELERQLLVEEPNIVHFSGHGEKDILFFSDAEHEIDEVSVEWLKRVLTDKKIDVLFLSACWSASIAEKLADTVGFCIGSTRKLEDFEAQDFSKAFYSALELKLTVRQAFDAASNMYDDGLFELSGNAADAPLYGDAPEPDNEIDSENLTVQQRITHSVAKLDQLKEKLYPAFKLDMWVIVGLFALAAAITGGLHFLLLPELEGAKELMKWIKWEPWPVFAALAGPPIGRAFSYIWMRTALPRMRKVSEQFTVMTADVQALALERMEKSVGRLESYE